MSEPDRKRIGFDRTLPQEWLDATVARVASGESTAAIAESVWRFLENKEAGTTHNSGRGKTMTVLNRVWLEVPIDAESLKQAALDCLSTVPGEQRVAVHWAMIAATHPFFFDVATHLGKLLKLNGQASRSQVKRRMIDLWGDRATLERAIQHVLKSMLEWGLLQEGPERGALRSVDHQVPVIEEVSLLLIHSVLIGVQQGIALQKLTGHPSLFPFALNFSGSSIRLNGRFSVHREGDQSDIVELAAASSLRGCPR